MIAITLILLVHYMHSDDDPNVPFPHINII